MDTVDSICSDSAGGDALHAGATAALWPGAPVIAIVGVILTLVQCFITYARWYNNYEPDIPQVRTLEPEIVEIMIQELTQTAAAPTP
ncbi:MAG: hypothetical protein AAFV33_22605 [Chloroflexota bacterium]